MSITNGSEVKQIQLYPPTKLVHELEQIKWIEDTDTKNEIIHPVLTIYQALDIKENTDDNHCNHCLCCPDSPLYFRGEILS
jgi:hypothetical protein